MTTREDFEKWAKDDKRLSKKVEWLEDYQLYEHLITQSAYESWQSCAARYEAERNAMLVAMAQKDAALQALDQEARNRLETAMNAHQWLRNLKMFPEWLDKALANMDECMATLKHNDPSFYDQIQQALSITHDSVRLVEATDVSDEEWNRFKSTGEGTKLYTIVKGEAG